MQRGVISTGIFLVNSLMANSLPTYSAIEIKRLCLEMEVDQDFKILAELIDEEIHLYSPDELPVLVEASMIIFTRSLLKFSLKQLK